MSQINTSSQHKSVRIGFILAVVGTLLFSFKSIFIKFLYQQGLDADTVLVLRMALALPIYLIIFVRLARRESFIAANQSQFRAIVLLGFFGYYLASLFDLMGLQYVSAQLERLSLFTYPFLVAIIGFILFKEALTTRLIIALLMSYSGLWLVMSEELSLTGNNVTLGVCLVLASALSFAFYVLLSKRYIKQIGSQLFTSIAMISSCIFGLLHGVIMVDWSVLQLTTSSWFWLMMLVVFSTVIPSFMMSEALNRVAPARVGVIGMLGPVFTIGLAVYLLNEPFTVSIAMGVLLVLLGAISLVLKPK